MSKNEDDSKQGQTFPRDTADIEAERQFLDGPTVFVNRFVIQTYGDGSLRITFAEQFSADSKVWPTYRTAVYMAKETADSFAKDLTAIVQAMSGSGERGNG